MQIRDLKKAWLQTEASTVVTFRNKIHVVHELLDVIHEESLISVEEKEKYVIKITYQQTKLESQGCLLGGC